MTNAETAFTSVSLFSRLGPKEVQALLRESRGCRYSKGSIVFHEGDPGEFFLVILSVRAKVVLQLQQGQ